jgi:hypothetical protein
LSFAGSSEQLEFSTLPSSMSLLWHRWKKLIISFGCTLSRGRSSSLLKWNNHLIAIYLIAACWPLWSALFALFL